MEATTAALWLTLMTLATPTTDNATEAGIDYRPYSVTPKSPWYSSAFYISPTLSTAFHVASILIAVVGTLANAYVLLALLLSKNCRSSNVNVFIIHQIIMDLISCVSLFLNLMLNEIRSRMTYSLAVFMCMFFQTFTITILATNASVAGLMIITLERYVKIVHPVAYRNHKRDWMTRAGIVLPWIFAVCTGPIQTWATSKVVNGRCMWGIFWANKELELTWSIAKFLLLYVLPLVIFVCGYWKILAVIRRQKLQVGQTQPQPGTSTSTGTKVPAKRTNTRTEMNVVKTMVLVSATFAICFLCTRIYAVLTTFHISPHAPALYYLFSVFSYSNQCLNPFIYATQYAVVETTQWWQSLVDRLCRRRNLAEQLPMSTVPESRAVD